MISYSGSPQMRRRLFTSLAAVLLETGWALAQVPGTAPSGPVPAGTAGPSSTLVPASASAPTASTPNAPAPMAPPAAATLAPYSNGTCGTGTCGEAPACGPIPDPWQDDSRFWFGGEYLLWHLKNGPIPPLSVQSTVPLSVPSA